MQFAKMTAAELPAVANARNGHCAILGAAMIIALGCCGSAQAAPVILQYSGLVDNHVGDPNPVVPGVSAGDAITFHVTADNGNAGLSSQTWDWTQIISATITAGSYTATLTGPVSGGFGGFSTDATGHLLTLGFGVGQDGADSNGGTPVSYFMDSANPVLIDNLGRDFGAVAPPNISNTSISVATTPIPGTLPLLISALGGLGLAGWQRKRMA